MLNKERVYSLNNSNLNTICLQMPFQNWLLDAIVENEKKGSVDVQQCESTAGGGKRATGERAPASSSDLITASLPSSGLGGFKGGGSSWLHCGHREQRADYWLLLQHVWYCSLLFCGVCLCTFMSGACIEGLTDTDVKQGCTDDERAGFWYLCGEILGPELPPVTHILLSAARARVIYEEFSLRLYERT